MSFRLFTSQGMVLSVLLFLILNTTLAAQPMFGPGYSNRAVRSGDCYKNTIALTKAIKSYSIAHKTKVNKIDLKLLNQLIAEGYLDSLPKEPGPREPDLWKYYDIASNGHVFCINHGFKTLGDLNKIPWGSPFDQLRSVGETNTDLLKRASKIGLKIRRKVDVVADVLYRVNSTFIFLASAAFLIIWLPTSIKRYAPFRPFTMGKGIIVLSMILAAIFFPSLMGDIHPILFSVFALLLFYLLDLALWTLRLLLTESQMVSVISSMQAIYNINEDEAALVLSTFKSSTMRADIVVKVMTFITMILIGSFLWALSHDADALNSAPRLIQVFFASTVFGLVTGMITFLAMVKSADRTPGRDYTMPTVRGLMLLIITGIYGCLHYYVMCFIPYMRIPESMVGLLAISSFMIGRSISIFFLNRNFIAVFKSPNK